jgi:hypothetical protein
VGKKHGQSQSLGGKNSLFSPHLLRTDHSQSSRHKRVLTSAGFGVQPGFQPSTARRPQTQQGGRKKKKHKSARKAHSNENTEAVTYPNNRDGSYSTYPRPSTTGEVARTLPTKPVALF